MAHADYDCCAVCDCKMGYNPSAESKEYLCSGCAADLAKEGVIIHGVNELMEWMKEEHPHKVVRILDKIGFRKCLYGSEVDDIYTAIHNEMGVAGDE